MKWAITNVRIDTSPQTYHTMGGMTKTIQTSPLEIEVELRLYDVDPGTVGSIEDIETLIRNESQPRYSKDAPSYMELLAKYEPEWLL